MNQQTPMYLFSEIYVLRLLIRQVFEKVLIRVANQRPSFKHNFDSPSKQSFENDTEQFDEPYKTMLRTNSIYMSWYRLVQLRKL